MKEFEKHIHNLIAPMRVSDVRQAELFLDFYTYLEDVKEEYMRRGVGQTEAARLALQSLHQSELLERVLRHASFRADEVSFRYKCRIFIQKVPFVSRLLHAEK